ncbi:hypothetical protein [Liquorilactobacillus aquaticus]|uniref:hypothetical protein n=1 Tax=Liquorilactobacillus aquaticus TaxID=392566 RepID=UPI0012EE9129|nr:hypothetical protein [Liquorilactobacillus aquaticus]
MDKKSPSLILGEDGEPNGEIKNRRYAIPNKHYVDAGIRVTAKDIVLVDKGGLN